MKRMKQWAALCGVAAFLLAGAMYAFAADKADGRRTIRPGPAAAKESGADKADAPKPDADGFYDAVQRQGPGRLEGRREPRDASRCRTATDRRERQGPAHLFYVGPVHDHDFKNFHLKAEVMTFPNANCGIYFHTKFQESGWPSQGFECQVNNTHSDPKKTGGLYAVKDVMNVAAGRGQRVVHLRHHRRGQARRS